MGLDGGVNMLKALALIGASVFVLAAADGCSRVYYHALRHEGGRAYFEQGSSQSFAPAYARRTEDFLSFDLENHTWTFVTEKEARGAASDAAPRKTLSVPPEKSKDLSEFDPPPDVFWQLFEKKTDLKPAGLAVDKARLGIWVLAQDGSVWLMSAKPLEPMRDPGADSPGAAKGWTLEDAEFQATPWTRTQLPPRAYPSDHPGISLAGRHVVWFTPQDLITSQSPIQALVLVSIEEHQAQTLAIPADKQGRRDLRSWFFLVDDELWYLVESKEPTAARLVRRRPDKPGDEQTVIELGEVHSLSLPREAGKYLVMAMDRQVVVIDKDSRTATVYSPPDRRGGDRFLHDALTGPPQAAFELIYGPIFFLFGKW
jgi:hypothetical protein